MSTQRELISEPIAWGFQTSLERAYIEEYLSQFGYSLESLEYLPTERAIELMRGASQFASLRMCEVEARSGLLDAIHGNVRSL